MKENHDLYQRIEALIHQVISDRLESCRGFSRLEWHDWPGTKSLSIPAANSVFGLLSKEGLLPTQKDPGADAMRTLGEALRRLRDEAPSIFAYNPPAPNLSPDDFKPGRIEMLCEERTSPTREDRAYQVLCALLSCSRAPMGSTAGELANIAWTMVECMEERGAQKDEK